MRKKNQSIPAMFLPMFRKGDEASKRTSVTSDLYVQEGRREETLGRTFLPSSLVTVDKQMQQWTLQAMFVLTFVDGPRFAFSDIDLSGN